MTTGKSPFSGDNPLVVMNARLTGDPVAPRKLNPEISPQVEEIILKAMAREPSDRYAGARDFKEDLDHPDKVRVTSRAERLVAPSTLKSRAFSARHVMVGILIPLAAVGGFLISAHLHKAQTSTTQPSSAPAVAASPNSRSGGR
jgi:serine/threonine-protein kinase